MALSVGRRLGPYEIVAPLGAGGMGEVYRARDRKLNRDVALKVLPEPFALDADRLARFRREAQVLASLNHPNIGGIYGLEETDGVKALVLELVEGPTLADRIGQGPIPLDEALPIARQMAEALEAAHEQGIIHRDLKPANIKVRADGTVKVLDFGLAKAFDSSPSATDVSQSPTITSPAMTGMGVILGTAAYMSPEQAKGRAVDKRSDIWAFGCVLYEMLTGRRAFPGDDVSDTLAGILRGDPDWNTLPASTPATVRRLLRRCLDKDRRERLPDIGVARLEIKETLTAPLTEAVALVPVLRLRLWRRALILSLSMLLLGAGIAGVVIWALRPAASTGPQSVSRFVITLPVDQQFMGGAASRRLVALSPQGTHLVYAANGRLYLRAIDQLNATPIQGTEGGSGGGASRDPFFSPDGQWIGFSRTGELRKVALTGGTPVKLADAPQPTWGASWGADDTIVYSQGPAGIWRVSGQGGTPERLVAVDEKKEAAHGPQLLPGGRAALFTLATAGSEWNEAQIVVQSLDSGERKVVLRGGRDARYVETGHLVYARSGTLLAVPFDLDRLEVSGGPVPVGEGVRDAGGTTGATHFSLSGDGTLVYVPGGPAQGPQRTLAWVSRSGAEQPLPAPARGYDGPRLSPDGRRVVVRVGEEGAQLWVYDLARDTLTRLTFEGSDNADPVWTPDGKRIAFQSNKDGLPNKIFWQLADGGGAVERLTSGTEQGSSQVPYSWSPDGQLLAFRESSRAIPLNIMMFRLSDRKVEPFLRTPFLEGGAKFSPDGRWLAYVSDEAGRPEVYVQPYPGPGGKWQISIEGGTEPIWNRNGRELFYRSGTKMMAVETTTQPNFSAGKPRVLFEGQYVLAVFPATDLTYDVSADGQRFLMVKETGQATSPTQINVVLNWTEELKRLVPTK